MLIASYMQVDRDRNSRCAGPVIGWRVGALYGGARDVGSPAIGRPAPITERHTPSGKVPARQRAFGEISSRARRPAEREQGWTDGQSVLYDGG